MQHGQSLNFARKANKFDQGPELPQTGSSSLNQLAMLGLACLLGVLGIAPLGKKKKH
jgi:LPXTG-motif cell wall-anchored protein